MSNSGGSSTDKLLRIIRGDGSEGPGSGPSSRRRAGGDRRAGGRRAVDRPEAETPQRRSWKDGRAGAAMRILFNPRSRTRKGITVGVDISPGTLRLVKMAHNGGGLPTLLEWSEIPFGPKGGPDSPEFPDFMRRQLDEFCKGGKGLEIWSLVSSAKAELFHINIPKVPSGKLSETVYWTAQKEKPFSEDEFIMDFEVQGTVEEKGVTKRRVLVYLVPKVEVERVRQLFADAGYKPAGLTISPIALQTIFRKRWVPEAERPCANVFMGRNWSRIDIFAQGNLVLSRGVNTGVNSLVEALVEEYNAGAHARAEAASQAAQAAGALVGDEVVLDLEFDTPEIEIPEIDAEPTPAASAPEAARAGGDSGADDLLELELDPEDSMAVQPDIAQPQPASEPEPEPEPEKTYLLDTDSAKALLYGKLLDRPLDADAVGMELSGPEVLEMAGSALQRLARQLERTFNFFSEMQGGMTVANMCFSGSLCSNRDLLDFLARELETPADLLDPIAQGPEPAAGVSLPEALADRLALNLVTGLALCDRTSTPNLLRTYKDKDREHKVVRQGNAVYALFLVGALALVGYWFHLSGVAETKQAELDGLKEKTRAFSPVVDQPMLMSLATRLNDNRRRLKDLSRRYEGLAALNELSLLAPEGLRLTSVSMDFSDTSPAPGGGKGKDAEKAGPSDGVLIVEGVVSGGPGMYDALLATFMLKIQGSPLFESAMILQREARRTSGGEEQLRFIVHAAIERGGAS